MAPLSPMMEQYFRIKEQHPDQILFFRLGDFYEMFYDDAITASRELELVLTGRDCGQEERAPMCGVPYHSCEAYIARLIKKGYKVAICEQMEDPKLVKGLVKREVIRVITPGTLIEANMLDEGANNYIASIYIGDGQAGVAFADISTGQVFVTCLPVEDCAALQNELTRFSPSEVVFNDALLSYPQMGAFLKERLRCCADLLGDAVYLDGEPKRLTEKQFGPEVCAPGGAAAEPQATCALGGLLHYLHETQKTGVERLVAIERYREERYMMLDAIARRNLELVQTMHSGDKRGSLLWVIDKTETAMGKRLLRRYLEQPLAHPVMIEKRLNAVDEIVSDSMLRLDLAEQLRGIYDLERLLTRIVCGATNPRELRSFASTLQKLPALKERVAGCHAKLLVDIHARIDPLSEIEQLISQAIMDEPPVSTKEGWFIRDGYNQELDEIRRMLTHTKDYLAQTEAAERERTGIKNLKIGFNKVFGYYIEITNSYRDMVPQEYIRKQTLANCERYITQDLKNLEDKILSGRERLAALELRLYEELRNRISVETVRIQRTADALAQLDVFTSLAVLAVEKNYTRPQITTDGGIIIEDGRHPVVEEMLGAGSRFVANDCTLDDRENRIAIITGPNMAGKSTYIRQVAVIVLLAQIGSFVPARRAVIGVVDGIFTRVGASDDLSAGQSTFMVEMSEVAQILKTATKDSLLILDEVGRGTSTFDGMSIARAMLEYIADRKKLGAKTLFATHYHELTELESLLPCVKNYNTAVKKRGEDITFLRRIVRGAVDDSYGIEVSKLAGLPDWIIRRAHEILADLEADRPISERRMTMRAAMEREQEQDGEQTTLVNSSPIEEAVRRLDLNTLTPLEALNKLYEFKAML
ncbi:MAG: DNA mismatch repair protein MutS [Oscillospiraceae bacterium]|nr:MAG: DNA mismatch repair protein MutS [Oscillospiraceae bacterium]